MSETIHNVTELPKTKIRPSRTLKIAVAATFAVAAAAFIARKQIELTESETSSATD